MQNKMTCRRFVMIAMIIITHIAVVSSRSKKNLSDVNEIDDFIYRTQPTYVEKLDCTWTGCQINGLEFDQDPSNIQYAPDFCNAIKNLKTTQSGLYCFNNQYLFCDFTKGWKVQKYVVIFALLFYSKLEKLR